MQQIVHWSTTPRKCVQHEWASTGEQQMRWEVPSKPLAVDDSLLLPEREVPVEIGINCQRGF